MILSQLKIQQEYFRDHKLNKVMTLIKKTHFNRTHTHTHIHICICIQGDSKKLKNDTANHAYDKDNKSHKNEGLQITY